MSGRQLMNQMIMAGFVGPFIVNEMRRLSPLSNQ